MNISVFKDNQSVVEVNLGAEVLGSLNSDTTFFVGRSPDCHVHLDDKQISREHAEISYQSGSWNIKQLSPFSRVIVNGTPYENKTLVGGDIITVGPYVLNVNIPEVVSNEGDSEDISKIEEPMDGVIEADESEEYEDFEEETVALDSEELSGELGEQDVSFDEVEGDYVEPEEVDEFADNEFSDTEDTFEGDVEEIEASSDDGDDDLFNTEEGESEYSEDNEDYAVDAFDNDEEDDGDESTRVIQAFAKIELEIFGEYAPYEKYVIDAPEVIIGRDPEKCQIVLNDPEVSGTHSVIRKNNITCTIEDLDSGNGTLVNGERINKSVLTNNDEIVIGGTTFTVKISSDFLQDEEQRLMPVEENQSVEVEEIVEVDADFEGELGEVVEGTPEKTSLLADLKNFRNLPPERRKKLLIYGVVLFILALFLMDDSPEKKKTVSKDDKKSQRLGQDSPVSKKKALLKKLSKEEEEFVESRYLLAKEQIDVGKYREAIEELNKIFNIIPEYKQAKQLSEVAGEGLEKIEQLEKKEREERERKEREAKVKILVEKAKEAVKDTQIVRAKSLFSEILTLDPENFDVPSLKQQIEEYERKIESERMEKAQKEAERKRQIDMLSSGKNYYLNKEWYNAILKLKDYVKKKDLDEDLLAEGSKMLSESKENLNNIIQPILGKARSLKEGQDLKGAYENYLQVLKFDLSNIEALDESNEIRERLKNRSMKIYREGIIAESLSLFEDAKEKFQEVQQVSPSDSEYYKKATEKLKDYLD